MKKSEKEVKAGKKGDKKLHKMAVERKLSKQMKSSEKADKQVHKDISKVLKREKAEHKAGVKGDKKLHEIAEKRKSVKKKESAAGKKGDKKLHKMAVKSKMKKVMTEFKDKDLHSGSKKGPVVTNPKQAVAIAYSESKKVGKKKK